MQKFPAVKLTLRFSGNGSTHHLQVPAVQEAIESIREAAEKANKFSGIWATTASEAAARFNQGFQAVNIGADFVAVASFSEWRVCRLWRLADF